MAAIPLIGTELQLAASMASPRASGSSNNVSGRSIPPILTLPSEMIEMIGEAADPYDLLAARLSCTEICRGITKPFVMTYFTIRRHIVTEHSLLALIDITAHPVFGPAIREIWISTISMAPSEYGELCRQYGKLSPIPYINLVRPYIRIADEKSRLDHGGGPELLAKALTNLRKLDVVVSLGTFQDHKSGAQGWGYQHACRIIPEAEYQTNNTICRLDLMFSAIQLSQYPLRVLSIDSVTDDWVYEDWPHAESAHNTCSQITELRVGDPAVLCDDYPETLFVPLFNGSSQLTKLHIELSPFSRKHSLLRDFRRAHLANLQDLSFVNLKAEAHYLVGFLSKHSSTLRSLTLANVELQDPNNWDLVFQEISETMCLEKLVASSLRANCAFGNGQYVEGDYTEPPFQEMEYDHCSMTHYSHIEYNLGEESDDKSVCVLRHSYSFVGFERVREGLKDLIGHFVPTESIDPKYEATWHNHDP